MVPPLEKELKCSSLTSFSMQMQQHCTAHNYNNVTFTGLMIFHFYPPTSTDTATATTTTHIMFVSRWFFLFM